MVQTDIILKNHHKKWRKLLYVRKLKSTAFKTRQLSYFLCLQWPVQIKIPIFSSPFRTHQAFAIEYLVKKDFLKHTFYGKSVSFLLFCSILELYLVNLVFVDLMQKSVSLSKGTTDGQFRKPVIFQSLMMMKHHLLCVLAYSKAWIKVHLLVVSETNDMQTCVLA